MAGRSAAAGGCEQASSEAVSQVLSMVKEGLVVPLSYQPRTVLLQAMYGPKQRALYSPVQRENIDFFPGHSTKASR